MPFTGDKFNTEFLPILILWYALGVLVQLPNTRRLRLAILPVMGVMAWRVGTRYHYDPSPEPGNNWISYSVCVSFSYSIKVSRAYSEARSVVPSLRDASRSRLRSLQAIQAHQVVYLTRRRFNYLLDPGLRSNVECN